MPKPKKRVSKNGKISYQIRVYAGYDRNGKQIERSMTWRPPDTMSEKQADREALRQAMKYEESVKNGTCFDSKTTFGEYSDSWFEDNKYMFAPKTSERYKALLKDINVAIGDMQLTKLQSHHLQEFYNNLRENGTKQTGAYAYSDKLRPLISEKGLTIKAVAHNSGLSAATVSAACRSEHISIESAKKIAAAFDRKAENLFEIHSETTGLSSKTILHYHRLISSILAQATRDRLVPFNIADHNYMKAPKLEQSEAAFLDEEQARHVLELLNDEPLKWKTAMYLLMFSGVRRGELLGLEWQDIDFDKRIIHIKRTSQYVQHMGIITKSPKNATSYRTVKLPEFVFDLLREYQAYWNKLRNDMLDRWEHFITITLADGSTQTVRNDRLFIKDDTTPMNPDSLTDWTSNFVKRNKLPHFTPHSLRHTHATLLIAEGVSIPTVSRRLGHSSITTTSKIYVHAIQSADEVASDVIDGKLNPFHHDNGKEEAK